LSSAHIPLALRRLVVERARGRCEYCRLAQAAQEATFHVDHVTPVAADGSTTQENLALACVSCSLRKGGRSAAQDPETDLHASLYDPRGERWADHFAWNGLELVGLTATGRATVAALAMNRELIVEIRAEEAALGRHPPVEGVPDL